MRIASQTSPAARSEMPSRDRPDPQNKIASAPRRGAASSTCRVPARAAPAPPRPPARTCPSRHRRNRGRSRLFRKLPKPAPADVRNASAIVCTSGMKNSSSRKTSEGAMRMYGRRAAQAGHPSPNPRLAQGEGASEGAAAVRLTRPSLHLARPGSAGRATSRALSRRRARRCASCASRCTTSWTV